MLQFPRIVIRKVKALSVAIFPYNMSKRQQETVKEKECLSVIKP